jgi:LPXTG-motif cell wall-anchored protein
VEYQFTVSNNGNVDLQDVYFYDPLLGFTSTPAALAVGASYQFVYGPYNISGDAWGESNRVVNIVSAAGIYNGEPVESGTADAVVDYDEPPNPGEPDIDLVKDVSPSTVSSRTTTVTYTFTVHNEGEIDLYNVEITDAAIGYYYEIGYLEAGETTTTSIDFDLENLGTDGYGTWDDDEFTNVAYVYGWYEQALPQVTDEESSEDSILRPMVMDDDDATVTYSTSPNPRPRPRPNPTPTPIDEEPTPAGPVVEETPIIEEAIPAAPLPQTGGIPSLLLYGIGALLTGGGAALKLRSRNGK